MQQTETATDMRPHRAARVVPIEPSLRLRYLKMLSVGAALLIFGINMVIIFPDPLLLSYSFFDFWFFCYLVIIVISVWPLKRWRVLEQRRQQAARYNLTTGAWERAVALPEPEASTLPDSLSIATRRNWLFTGIGAFFLFLWLCLVGAILYTNAHDLLQAVQHGRALAVVAWEISLNVLSFLFFTWLASLFLFTDSRQRLAATSEGLLAERGRRTSFIPWSQASLFAIVGQARGKQGPLLFYELASKNTVIRWTSLNARGFRGIGRALPASVMLLGGIQIRPEAAFSQQVQELNAIIAERTRLPLYDLR